MMHIETTVKKARAQELIIIGNLSQSLTSGPVQFSIESAIEVTEERAETIHELFVGDERLIDGALADLEKHHVLLLAGGPECGTSTMAIYLGTRLAESAHLQSTLVVSPLDPKVEIDLRKIDFAKRTIVFTDGFRNHDLLGFFSRGDGLEWEGLTGKLRANSAYLIFTAEPDVIAGFPVARRLVPPLAPDLVGRGLDLRIKWLERERQLTAEHIRQLTGNREHLIDDLKTLPRVVRFLDQYIAGDPDLAAALQRFHDIPFWFSKDLTADVEAWCFAMTLALAHVVRNGSGVGWYEFERIRRAVTQRIKDDPELFFRSAGRTTGQLLSDDALLHRARAEVVWESSRTGDAVRFVDRSYAATIWQTLAVHHRRALTTLIPVLRMIAEDERGPGSYSIRSLAAQMLGRIGELDPFSISIPLIQRDWVGALDHGQQAYVGRLLQGMRTSSNRAYRQAAIGAVDSLTTDSGDDAKTNDRLLTAISAYALLGEQELPLAMEKLGMIATHKLAPVMANLQQIEQVVEQVEQHLSGAESPQAVEDLLQHRLRLSRIAERLSAQQVTLLLPVKQAVVYLCLTADPIEVLDSMRTWISQGGETATLVVLLFLHDGIADDLEAAAANVQLLSGGERITPIVRSLRNSAATAEKFGAFLADLRISLDQSTSLSPKLRRELEERLANHYPKGESARTEESDHHESAVPDRTGSKGVPGIIGVALGGHPDA